MTSHHEGFTAESIERARTALAEDLEADIRVLPVTLQLIEDLLDNLWETHRKLVSIRDVGWTLHEEGINTAAQIDTQLATQLLPVIHQIAADLANTASGEVTR